MIILLLSVTLLLVLYPSDAHAWTAAAAIVTYLAGKAFAVTFAGLAVTAGLALAITMAAGFAMSALMSLMMGSQSGNARSNSTRGQLLNTCDSQLPLPIVYGRQRIGINRVYQGVSPTDNDYLYIIGTLCEGEIEGLAVVDEVPQVFLNDKIYTEYGTSFSYEFFTGTANQSVCATLQAAMSDLPVNDQWTDPLRNTAYIFCTLKYDMDKFQGVPEITCLIDGLKVYNPATTLTAFSDSPALCARDLMTRRTSRGGLEIDSARINDTLVTSVAAYCALVDTEKTTAWTCNLALLDNSAVINNLSMILACFRGDVVYSGTTFNMRYSDLDYESSVMDIDEDDIIESGAGSSLTIVQPDIFDTPNAVRIKFVNEDKNYQMDDYVLADSAAAIADGDYREKEIMLRGTNTQINAMKMANYFLERLRYNKSISFVMGSRGAALEPFDIIRVSVADYGWVLKLFRVVETHLSPDGVVSVSATEELATFYDDTYNITSRAWHDTTLPSVLDPVPSVTNAQIAEEVYYYRERSFTRLKITFSPPVGYPQWDYADVYVKIGSGDYKFMTKAVSSYNIDPVNEGEIYYCKMVSVSVFGSKEPYANGITVSKTVEGVTTIPDDVTGFNGVASGDSIIFYATSLASPDVVRYELRQGPTWAGAVTVATNETPNFRINGVRPGTFVFWLAAQDNAGVYSSTPVSTSVVVFYPPGYVELPTYGSWVWDFDAIGTHSNTEHVTHNSTDALKCSHTAGVLTGTWTSPEYDLGALVTVRIWSDFLADFTSPAGTWTSLVGSANWEDVLIPSTIKWYQFTQPVTSGAVRATIKWGTSSGVYPNSADKFELSSIEFEARYLQVVITITDPTDDANLYLYTLNNTAAIASDRV